MQLTVLTLNLWNISEPLAPRMAALEAGLKTLRPDIVCLQEVAVDPRTRQRQSAFAAGACGLTHIVDDEQLSIYRAIRLNAATPSPCPKSSTTNRGKRC